MRKDKKITFNIYNKSALSRTSCQQPPTVFRRKDDMHALRRKSDGNSGGGGADPKGLVRGRRVGVEVPLPPEEGSDEEA